MVKISIFVLVCLACSTLGYPKTRLQASELFPFPFVTRDGWEARPPTSVAHLEGPVPYVVIHHTYIPDVCKSRSQCKADMRSMQRSHMDTNGWNDIGYNFAVGGEGAVYEGRGWEAVGAHAVGYNTQGIGIVLIGDFVSHLPVAHQLQSAKNLIIAGVKLGYIAPDYKLITHRQVSATECPGEALYNEVSTWDHFTVLDEHN